MKNIIITIAGPTASGKTLIREILQSSLSELGAEIKFDDTTSHTLELLKKLKTSKPLVNTHVLINVIQTQIKID